MLRAIVCLLIGTVCLVGAAVSTRRAGESKSGMVVEETGPAHRQESPAAPVRSGGAVIVGGQVRTPGEVPFISGATLGSVIQKAGGSTGFGSLRRVSVIRGGATTHYDLTTPGGPGTPVRPGDVIEVPQGSPFGRSPDFSVTRLPSCPLGPGFPPSASHPSPSAGCR
ncbi:MAG: hypothetical protein JWO82_1960 [Akkermansiaceae bacterium]|nr:hypothetical protein [Akkermansiaceae bacterium]